jgi:predicted outer membrane protein
VTYNRLAKLTGNQFDGAFAKDMVADHKSDIKAFEKESTKNDAASSYAKETLPTLRKHLQAAESRTALAVRYIPDVCAAQRAAQRAAHRARL